MYTLKITTQSVQHIPESVEHRAQKMDHRAQSIEHSSLSVQHRVKYRAQNIECTAKSAELSIECRVQRIASMVRAITSLLLAGEDQPEPKQCQQNKQRANKGVKNLILKKHFDLWKNGSISFLSMPLAFTAVGRYQIVPTKKVLSQHDTS